MIFNKEGNGAVELRKVTSSYYANNDFSRIEATVRNVEFDVMSVLGKDVWGAITSMYDSDEPSKEEQLIVFFAQRAVGMMATMQYARLNDLSHEDDGRKVKIDRDNEARPFEWQLAKDERVHMEAYYSALNNLVEVLESENIEAWKDSALRKRANGLLVRSWEYLGAASGVQATPWLYWQMVPYLQESQHFVSKAYGAGFSALVVKAHDEDAEVDSAEQSLIDAARKAELLTALGILCRRTRLTALPWGVMGAVSSSGGGDRVAAGSEEQVKRYAASLSKDAAYWLNEMKILRDDIAGQKDDVRMFHEPENRAENKYFRV